MADFSVIIVSYNVRDYLRQCLRSLLRSLAGFDAEIIVVDNNSPDGSVVMVQREFPSVSLVTNRENRGFARASNQGLGMASGRWIALVNPDTLIMDDTFQVCVDFLEGHPEAGMAGCKIINPDGTLQPACRRSYPTPWVAFTKLAGLSALFPKSRLFGRYNVTYLDENEISEVEAISGSFMVVRREAAEQAGPLDESFFMYGEDLDWCFRIRARGWKIFYLPGTRIVHYKGKSGSGRSFAGLKMFYDAMYVFVRKHFTNSWSIPKPVIIAGIWIKQLLAYLIHPLAIVRYWLADCLFLQAGLAGALLIRFGDLRHWTAYLLINGVYTLVWTAVFSGAGLYGRPRPGHLTPAAAVLSGLILNAAVTFFFPQFAFSRQVLVTAAVLDTLFISGWRYLVFRILREMSKTIPGTPVILAGEEDSIRGVTRWIGDHPRCGRRILGYTVWNRGAEAGLDDVLQLGSSEDLPRLAREHRAEEIIFPFEKVQEKTILLTLFACRTDHIDTAVAVPDPGHITGFAPAYMSCGGRVLTYSPALYREVNACCKRVFDLAVAIILLPVWAAAAILAALDPRRGREMVRISDGGRSFIGIRRFCRDGRPAEGLFETLSFLPAVFRGTMSVCGTAPSLYTDAATGYGCKPGLIDICAAAGVTAHGMTIPAVRCVHDYVYHYSIATDVKLLLKAITPGKR
ncbi:glycosyltransferase [bacterium]|nr:glycosyltransferase [bacterium]